MTEKSIAQDIKDTTEKVKNYPLYLRTESSPARTRRDRSKTLGSGVVSIANASLQNEEKHVFLQPDEFRLAIEKFPVTPTGESRDEA